jgi:hypothetical protein
MSMTYTLHMSLRRHSSSEKESFFKTGVSVKSRFKRRANARLKV